MKVQIKGGGHHFSIILPTGLIFSTTSARIANYFSRKYAPEAMACIPPEAVEALCAEFRRIKKKYGSWDLVEVESTDGEQVRIKL